LPKVKLGGGGGGCNLAATIGHLTLWTTRHRSGRTLVDRCDFITDMGHRTPAGSRAELGYSGGGPQWLVTELGIFDYDIDGDINRDTHGTARLRQLFPDITLDEVRAVTGFELRVAPALGPVRPPSTAELSVLRGIDPLGVRRSEFSAAELRRTFRHSTIGRCVC
jgi:glutaconate CoA-transferase subunit B